MKALLGKIDGTSCLVLLWEQPTTNLNARPKTPTAALKGPTTVVGVVVSHPGKLSFSSPNWRAYC